MRVTMTLDTKDRGIYVTDVALSLIDRMIEHCETHGYTTRKVYIVIQEINKVEMMIKDVLQYFHYFIRPDFRQKPDIEMATEKYKEIADKQTIEELRDIVGRTHKIDFDGLGTSRVELIQKVAYDQEVDGEEDETGET